MKIEKNIALLAIVSTLLVGVGGGLFLGSQLKNSSADVVATPSETSLDSQSITLGILNGGGPGGPTCSEDTSFETQEVLKNVTDASGLARSYGSADYTTFIGYAQNSLQQRAQGLRSQIITFYQSSYHDRDAAEAAFNANVADFGTLAVWLKDNSNAIIKAAGVDSSRGAVGYYDGAMHWYKMYKRYGSLFEKSKDYDLQHQLHFSTNIGLSSNLIPKLTAEGTYKIGGSIIKGSASYICDNLGSGVSLSSNNTSFDAKLTIILPAVKVGNGTADLSFSRSLSGQTQANLTGKLKF